MDGKPVTGTSESFLGRWSRRKRDNEEDRESVALTRDPEAASAVLPAEEPPSLTDADMPAVESLADDDDFSGFLSAGVSDALRRSALRRLFRSPKFNVTDGLDDYAEDFANFAPLGDIVTADMKHRIKRLMDAAAEDAEHAGSEQVEHVEARDGVEPEPRANEETDGNDPEEGAQS